MLPGPINSRSVYGLDGLWEETARLKMVLSRSFWKSLCKGYS